MVGVAIAGAAVVGAVGTVVASQNQADAARSAAQTQANAAARGQDLQAQEFNAIQQNLGPYNFAGQNALTQQQFGTGTLGALSSLTDAQKAALTPAQLNALGAAPGGVIGPGQADLTKPFAPTLDQLAQTPGYQFTLQQGTNAVQNAYAAQGLAGSGAAIRGSVQFAEGLAGTTFQQQFNNYLAQNKQINDILQGQVNTGEAAAANLASAGVASTANQASLIAQGGNALGAGQVAAANALSSGLSSLSGTGGTSALLYALNSQGMFGNPTQPTTTIPQTGITFGDPGASGFKLS